MICLMNMRYEGLETLDKRCSRRIAAQTGEDGKADLADKLSGLS